MIAITWLNIWVLVNDINRSFLNHTRRVTTITAERSLTTRATFCLRTYWHKHQAPDDAFHKRFHFSVDRHFHCWHFFLPLWFYGEKNNLRLLENRYFISFLQNCWRRKAAWTLFKFSISFLFVFMIFTLEHSLLIFYNLVLISGCFILI